MRCCSKRPATFSSAACRLVLVLVLGLTAHSSAARASLFDPRSTVHFYIVQGRLLETQTAQVKDYVTDRWRHYHEPNQLGGEPRQWPIIQVRNGSTDIESATFDDHRIADAADQNLAVQSFFDRALARLRSGRVKTETEPYLDLDLAMRDLETLLPRVLLKVDERRRQTGSAGALTVIVHLMADDVRLPTEPRGVPYTLRDYRVSDSCLEGRGMASVRATWGQGGPGRRNIDVVFVLASSSPFPEPTERTLALAFAGGGRTGERSAFVRDGVACAMPLVGSSPDLAPILGGTCESKAYTGSELARKGEVPRCAPPSPRAEFEQLMSQRTTTVRDALVLSAGRAGRIVAALAGPAAMSVIRPPAQQAALPVQTTDMPRPGTDGPGAAPPQPPAAAGGSPTLPSPPAAIPAAAPPSAQPANPSSGSIHSVPADPPHAPMVPVPTLPAPSSPPPGSQPPAAPPPAASLPSPALQPVQPPAPTPAERRIKPAVAATAGAVFRRSASIPAGFNIEGAVTAAPAGLEIVAFPEAQPPAASGGFRVDRKVAARYPSGTYVLYANVPKGTGCAPDGTVGFTYAIVGIRVEDADHGTYDVRIQGVCDASAERLVPFGKARLK